MTKLPTIETAEGETITLPYKWHICGSCRGDGKSSAYLGAFTAEDMREDPDFAEEYMAGRYDRTCEECNGAGKVALVDRRGCKPELLAEWDEMRRFDAECRREQENEARMLGEWR